MFSMEIVFTPFLKIDLISVVYKKQKNNEYTPLKRKTNEFDNIFLGNLFLGKLKHFLVGSWGIQVLANKRRCT